MMNLAKMSTNGQITVPAEIRRMLNVKAEDKIVFLQNENGEIIVQKLNVANLRKSPVLDTNTAVG
ncbi:MAG: AbrB/MazE/SpoVT family DNA-binding domain-containing protein [Defluviitaleaceae bacterium]|nr:AbrB/MazE/SpoVT family DNA-binding domain-containing protein [Defluviitaleaceae bacterium]MCL2363652.1 AbrB/MazE/SpoVT family DNA-binding domain-containing protein [Defluviitaleaceae bacterium]